MLNKWFEFGFYVDQSMRSAMPCGTSSKRDSATKSNQSRVHKYPYRQIVQRRKRRLENINVVNLWDSLPEAVYLTFEVMESGLSRLQPRLYTWIFIPLDVFCLVLQGVGGSVDASAETDPERLRIGNNIIIAGIVLQVAVLSGFGLLSLDFFWRVRRHHHQQQQQQCHSPVDNDTESTTTRRRVWKDPQFRIFCTSVAAAYLGILTRCIYRYIASAFNRRKPRYILGPGLTGS